MHATNSVLERSGGGGGGGGGKFSHHARAICHVPPHESITVEEVLAHSPPQRALSKKLDMHAFQPLLSSSSPVNKARILSVSAPHTGSWISVIPSTGLELHSAECQVALRWWLRFPVSTLSRYCP